MLLDPNLIPKFKSQLVKPYVFAPDLIRDPLTNEIIAHNYTITLTKGYQQVLPKGFPKTMVFGYAGAVFSRRDCKETTGYCFSSPGSTILAKRGIKINVDWVNELDGNHPLPVDPTICWADPNQLGDVSPEVVPPFPLGLALAQKPIPVVSHLHGGQTATIYDGNPDAWYTLENKKFGRSFVTSTYQYLNCNSSRTLWYHDHVFGMTRLNNYAGLSGFYLISDKHNPLDYPGKLLPKYKYDIPILIKDCFFSEDGSLYFPTVGDAPAIHPYWRPEFYGNCIIVNGKTWPNLNVERTVYRLRLLNASNARFYNLSFSNEMTFVEIATDGGYVETPVELTSLLIAPSERYEILVDFSKCKPNSQIILTNNAKAPYPDGDIPDPNNNGLIMSFTVKKSKAVVLHKLPKKLNDIPVLTPNVPNRVLTLIENVVDDVSLGVYLNGQSYHSPVSETPLVGSTEEWILVNLTQDSHPIHVHLINFLIKDRQLFDVNAYTAQWQALNGTELPLTKPTISVPVENYLIGEPLAPSPCEIGWKDTIRVPPGQVTRIIIRFAPNDVKPGEVQPGINLFPFNPSAGTEYVWHCHILGHEDNEMMRPLKIITPPNPNGGC